MAINLTKCLYEGVIVQRELIVNAAEEWNIREVLREGNEWLGWMNGMTVALGNIWMTIEAARNIGRS